MQLQFYQAMAFVVYAWNRFAPKNVTKQRMANLLTSVVTATPRCTSNVRQNGLLSASGFCSLKRTRQAQCQRRWELLHYHQSTTDNTTVGMT